MPSLKEICEVIYLTACLSLTKNNSQTFWSLNIVWWLHMHMTLKQGKNISYKNNTLLNGQGLHLHLKNFENDFAKNKICIVDYVRCWKRQPDNILKLKELFLNIISHGTSFISDHSIVPSSSISFDDYSTVIFF